MQARGRTCGGRLDSYQPRLRLGALSAYRLSIDRTRTRAKSS
jgi:hypothetical protein